MVTPLQHKIYEFIRQYKEEHGYAPTLVEITEGIGISPKSISLVSRSIHALAASGRLKISNRGYRNIEVVLDPEGKSLPLLGRIAAGEPIEAFEDKRIICLGDVLGGPGRFALEVKGDSMIEDGI